ncbi:MAG: N-acetylglutaminylglutamine amidotransferase [Desulfobulbaceae bacterium]|nr:N-acetylglutaminylglutamine amidotransferase [Desulfobulbaceae bacterium]MDY0351316.1 N-acetylglutaminylglutamine amidotransferase [Desulfobulbaceae bacterium]
MCGICGEIRFDGAPADVQAVEKMTCGMKARGPDAGGIFAQGRIAAGHRRLRIIDLSEHSQQPMIDSELGLGIVYNGAIYNYPQLKDELLRLGYRFFSSGDTEVILKAYHAWGADCVRHFNGMFAFAIWERDSGSVFLARDRVGIKPLYYHAAGGKLRFASSLPALFASGGISSEIDPIALHHYMNFHSVVPAPRTILKDIKKLEPGTTLRILPDGGMDKRTYWHLSFQRDQADNERSFADWQELVLDQLRLSVQRRLIADVPVGVLLSGGLDSSLIVGLLAEAGQKKLHTYSVGFESVNDEQGDEFFYSDIVARRFDTEHHKIFVSSAELLPSLEGAVRAMSEPMVSHDAVGFYLLSREVAKKNKVVQSGQGADEVFAGYHWYPPMMDSDRPVDDYLALFRDRSHDEFLAITRQAYRGEDYSRQFVADHFRLPGAVEPIDKTLRIDTTIMLVDDPVKRVDNMTMAWGLEARVPFLDHELIELSARIPGRYKTGGQDGKYVLKEAARRIIPHEVIDRPKGYFPVPALKYIRGEFLEFVKNIVHDPSFAKRRMFRKKYVDQLLAEPEEHITPLRGSKLWQIALLEYWLQTNNL